MLERIDEGGPITREQLTATLDTKLCERPGHRLSFAGLHTFLTNTNGDLGLSARGVEWLLSSATPSPDWGAADRAPDAFPLREWQDEALRAWAEHGRHGVIEAVTGTGKSRVGLEAAREAICDDFNVLVVVPTADLVDQWTRSLRRGGITSVGHRGEGRRDSFNTHDVLVSTVQSLYLDPPSRHDGKVLLIADECHRYGSEEWRNVLSPTYRRRLGLTATFDRTDDGLEVLRSYFGGSPVYSIGFRRAIDDGVVAAYDVSLLGVELSAKERKEYDAAHDLVLEARATLLAQGFPEGPFGEFMREVSKATEGDADYLIEDAARQYLSAFSERIEIVANCRAKADLVPLLAPTLRRSQGALVFTRRVETTEAISSTLSTTGLDLPAVHSKLPRAVRDDRLSRLRARAVDGLVAATVLDEGIDVPEVDLGIVMSGSKSRRQIIQRMGRVLRLKHDGRNAHFVVVYARNTIEDLSKGSGLESSLDLILETANSVTELYVECGVLRSMAPQQSPPQVGPSAVVLPGMPASTPVLDIDAEKLPMTRRALDAYKAAHGVEDDEAERDLRELLADFLKLADCKPIDGVPQGYRLRHKGFAVVVTPDRFVGYRSLRKDANTWSDISSSDVASAGTFQNEEPAPEPEPVLGLTVSEPDGEQLEPSSTVEPELAQDDATSDFAVGAAADPEVVSLPSSASTAPDKEPTGGDLLVDQLERLAALFTSGVLTAGEFSAAKARVLGIED